MDKNENILDKTQRREKRDRMLLSAAAADLSLTDGVRDMRAISGMTQQDFARHRGVSTRVIKAIELGQGNPTVATLNRIGEFFGLQVAFVPLRQASRTENDSQPETMLAAASNDSSSSGLSNLLQDMRKYQDELKEQARLLAEGIKIFEESAAAAIGLYKDRKNETSSQRVSPTKTATVRKKRKSGV